MCINPIYLDNVVNFVGDKIPIPCGKCLSCRVDKRILWSNRINLECLKYHGFAFCTFTYDELYLPYQSNSLYPTLCKKHFSMYIDKIRHWTKKRANSAHSDFQNWKYFACGEYGDKFNRPHYHCIFLGLDHIECRKIFERSWKFGMVKVLPMRSGSVNYILKYLFKNDSADSRGQFVDNGLEPPFLSFSPSLGSDLFYSQKDNINKYGVMKFGTRSIPVPSYYKNKIFDYNENSLCDYENVYYNNFDKCIQDAYSLGYSDVYKYLRERPIAHERNLVSKALKDCAPVDNTLNLVTSKIQFDSDTLALNALVVD